MQFCAGSACLLKFKIIVGTTNLLQDVLCGDRLKHILFGRFLYLSANQQFVKYKVGLFKVENNVQFTNLDGGEGKRYENGIFPLSNIFLHLLTLPKYLSSNSTYLWIISNVSNSLSFCSMAQQKYKLAYLEGYEMGHRISFIRVNIVVVHQPLVDYFAVLPLQKRAHLGLTGENCCDQFAGDFLLCLVWIRHVPLLKPQFALSAEQQHKQHLDEKGRGVPETQV